MKTAFTFVKVQIKILIQFMFMMKHLNITTLNTFWDVAKKSCKRGYKTGIFNTVVPVYKTVNNGVDVNHYIPTVRLPCDFCNKNYLNVTLISQRCTA